MMANSSLAKKLKIKSSLRIVVINPPPGYLDELGSLPEGVELATKPEGQFDFVHLFVQNSAELEGLLPLALQSLKEDAIFRISFPKRSSKMQTDLSRDHGWEALHKAGQKGEALVSINDTWSAMRFRAGQITNDQEMLEAQYAGKKA